ncbi:MAG: hypothetical protein EHM30_12445 [Desulfobacteraceae bacterium]|nr:MAG: hypothetical protein EHM30_12445 [Desulfobacteraceae bacterium]
MKKLSMVILLGLLVVTLSGCAVERWVVKLPPDFPQAVYKKYVSYCKQYTRKWCAEHGDTTTSFFKESKNESLTLSKTECTSSYQTEVYNNCLREKGYILEMER